MLTSHYVRFTTRKYKKYRPQSYFLVFILIHVFPFVVMHLGAVAAMLFRHHHNKTVQDVLKRLDRDKLIGTLVFSDPATGMEVWNLGSSQPSFCCTFTTDIVI